jgi:protein-S-isoprenylcysteine O-methyltransferase Ste14
MRSSPTTLGPAVICTAGVLQLALLMGPSVLVNGYSGWVSWRVVLFLGLVSVWLVAEGTLAVRWRPGNIVDHGGGLSSGATASAILITFWVSLATSAGPKADVSPMVVGAGAAMMVAGVGLRCLAIGTLRRFFLDDVALQWGQPLITTGVYSWMRHPSEVGNVAIAFGGTMVLASSIGLATGAGLVLPTVIHRLRSEDRLLRAEYGTSFDRYAGKTGWFGPRGRRRAPAGVN